MKTGLGFFSARPQRAKTKGLGVVLGCLFGIAGAAHADPVALVLDKSAAVSFPAFSELSAGDTVDLGNSGYIDILDYNACREVRFTSGRVSFSADGYVLDGAEEKELRAGNCLKAGGSTQTASADKGLTVTLRGLKPANKVAASLMLRFDNDIQKQFDSVVVSFEGAEPKRFEMGGNILTEMPVREQEADSVGVELYLQGNSEDDDVVSRKFTIDPAAVGRKTAVVIVE